MLEQLYDFGYRIGHYELRMEYPKDGLYAREVPGVGKVWDIPREKLGHMNDWLNKNGYGEANLWISKKN